MIFKNAKLYGNQAMIYSLLVLSFIFISNNSVYSHDYLVDESIINPNDFIVDENENIYLYDESKYTLNKIDYKKSELLSFSKVDFKRIDSFLVDNDYINKSYKCFSNKQSNYGKMISIDYLRNRGVNENVINNEIQNPLSNILIEGNKVYATGFIYFHYEIDNQWQKVPDDLIFSLQNEKLVPYYFPKQSEIRKFIGKEPCLNNGTFYFLNTFLENADSITMDKFIFKFKNGKISYLPALKNYKIDLKNFYNLDSKLIYYKNKLLICEINNNRIYDVFDDKVLIDLGEKGLFSLKMVKDNSNNISMKAELFNKYFTCNENYLFVMQQREINSTNGKQASVQNIIVIKDNKIIKRFNANKMNKSVNNLVSFYAKGNKLYYLYYDKDENTHISDIDINKLLEIR